MKKTTLLLTFAFLVSLTVYGRGYKEEPAPGAASAQTVASTSWTGAFLLAAGVESSVTTLAPSDLRHPPEYELLPSQAVELSEADFIVFAGYESFAPRLMDGSLQTRGKAIRINTVNSLSVFRESILKLAEEFGTETAAEQNLKALETQVADIKEEIRAAGYQDIPVICHAFLKEMAEDFGFTVIGVFGPAPPEAGLLVQLAESSPGLIIDNWHSDAGKSISRTLSGIPVVSLINFPGHEGTRTLGDVLEYNRQRLMEGLMNRN